MLASIILIFLITWLLKSKPMFYGAMFKSEGTVGLGVVVRDVNGNFIGGLTWCLNAVGEVDLLEAMAAFHAVLFASDISLKRLFLRVTLSRLSMEFSLQVMIFLLLV
uniref:RNase H type-1 domain-containing protein n=1 Tax=Davidia involucrata TaxID=16924 RepID=A0A5B7BEC0_DAVIN